jgi:prevent-host-death family protein
MIKPTATKFRQHTGNYFDAVENGERIIVSRYGKPVAEVWPINRSQAPS